MSAPASDSPVYDGYAPLPTASWRRAAAAGLNLTFDFPLDQPSDCYASSPVACSDSSCSSMPSPITPYGYPLTPQEPEGTSEGDGSWDLIPYNVPWGEEYCDYKPGTLPGPQGSCMFLRSPTPVKKKRTTRACTKCRDRKAKCSGTRPTCARCLSRGHICQYDSEEPKRSSGPTLARQRRRDKTFPSQSPSSSGTSNAVVLPGDADVAACMQRLPLKHEDADASLMLEHHHYHSSHIEAQACGAVQHVNGYAQDHHYASPSYVEHADLCVYSSPVESQGQMNTHASIGDEEYFPGTSVQQPASLYAPRPLRYSPPVPFLASVDNGLHETPGRVEHLTMLPQPCVNGQLVMSHVAPADAYVYTAPYDDVQLYGQAAPLQFSQPSYATLGDQEEYLFKPAPTAYVLPFTAEQGNTVAQYYEASAYYGQDIGIMPQQTYDVFAG